MVYPVGNAQRKCIFCLLVLNYMFLEKHVKCDSFHLVLGDISTFFCVYLCQSQMWCYERSIHRNLAGYSYLEKNFA